MPNATLDPAPDLAPSPSPWRSAEPEARSKRRRLLAGVAAAFVVVGAVFGFPTGREVITGWLLLVLWAACAGDLRVWRRTVARDWLPLLTVLFAYDLMRGYANEIGGRLFALPSYLSSPTDPRLRAQANLTEPIAVDRALFGGHVPTVWLQERLYDAGHVHWYDLLAVGVYFSHFLVSLALAVLLWAVAYPVFRRYLATLVTLTLTTLATYALYPAAPPWMASLNGFLPAGVVRVVPATLSSVGGHTVNSAIERGAAYSNPVAAVPSLHAAIPMMLLLFAWPLVGPRVRALLVAYVGVMAFTLVYAGEHYVIDVLLGWLYAAGSVWAVRSLSGLGGLRTRSQGSNAPRAAERC